MSAKTTNAAALVHLDAAYEGALDLKTSRMGDIDVRNMTRADPAGLGRERKVEWWRKPGGKTAQGRVEWGGSAPSQTRHTGLVSIQSDEDIHVRF